MKSARAEVELAHRDITDAYRLPTKEKTGIRPLIIQFTSRPDRDAVLWARKKLKGFSSSQQTAVYVNELLTKQNAKIFTHARTMVKQGTLHRAWTADGWVRVLLTDDPHTKPRKILDINDLLAIEVPK